MAAGVGGDKEGLGVECVRVWAKAAKVGGEYDFMTEQGRLLKT